MGRIDRRQFIEGVIAASLAVGFDLAPAEAQAPAGRKLGTCGPPPRKNPTRQTSAEGMPPLPPPAVPE